MVPFFANEDTKTPIKVALLCMIINLILNLILIRDFLHVGLAISTSIAAWINAIILSILLHKKLGFVFQVSIIKVFIKVLIASVVMSVFTTKLFKFLQLKNLDFFSTNLSLITCIIFGIIVYLVAIYILGTKELELKKWKSQKKKIT